MATITPTTIAPNLDAIAAVLDELVERARTTGSIPTVSATSNWHQAWNDAHGSTEGDFGRAAARLDRADNEYLAAQLGGVTPEDLAEVRSTADALTPRGFAPNPTIVNAVADRISQLQRGQQPGRSAGAETPDRDSGNFGHEDDERRPGRPAGFLARIRDAARPVTEPIGKAWTKTKERWSNLPFGWKVAVGVATIAVGPLGGAAVLGMRWGAKKTASKLLRATDPDRERSRVDRDTAEDLTEDRADTLAPGVDREPDLAPTPVDVGTPELAPGDVGTPEPTPDWRASERGEPGAVPAAGTPDPLVNPETPTPSVVQDPAPAAGTPEPLVNPETPTPSVIQVPAPAAGHTAGDGLTTAQRHLVDQVKAVYIAHFGLAVTDGETTAFVSDDAHPGIRSDERVVDPVELKVLAGRVESDLVTDLPTWAREAVGADLQARPLSEYAATALSELGLEQGTVEVTVIRPIDQGAGR